MQPHNLTAHNVENAKPGPVRREVRDGLLRGLWLFVHPSGRKSFGVRYSFGGRRVKLILGPYPGLSLAVARDRAQAVLTAVASGIDPRAKTAEVSFADAVDLYNATHVSTLRPSTARYVKYELEIASTVWRGRSLASITRREVIALADDAERRGPTVRNSCIRILAGFFSFCEGRDLIERSPAHGVKAKRKKPRERFLDDAELAAVWRAADKCGGAPGALTKLLMLTGARRNEISFLSWDEISADAIVLGPDRTKTGTKLHIPLTDAMREVLAPLHGNGQYVLCGDRPLNVSGSTKNKIIADIPDWAFHDLRRSFATGLARLGVALPVIEKCLNHTLGGILKTYQRHDYARECKAAWDKWSAHVDLIARRPY